MSIAGEVVRRGKMGLGGTLGFIYLSAGFIVPWLDIWEEGLAPRLRWVCDEGKWIGTLRTFRGWPGRKGHEVVTGSASLKKSTSLSSWYCDAG